MESSIRRRLQQVLCLDWLSFQRLRLLSDEISGRLYSVCPLAFRPEAGRATSRSTSRTIQPPTLVDSRYWTSGTEVHLALLDAVAIMMTHARFPLSIVYTLYTVYETSTISTSSNVSLKSLTQI